MIWVSKALSFVNNFLKTSSVPVLTIKEEVELIWASISSSQFACRGLTPNMQLDGHLASWGPGKVMFILVGSVTLYTTILILMHPVVDPVL